MQNKDLLEELESFSSKKRINRKFIYIATAIVSFLAIVLFFIFNGNNKSNKIEYITKKVTQGDLSVVVSTTGNLNPTNSVEIGIEVSGTLKEIFVDFNDEVKAGQILAKIDTVKLQSQVDSSTAALAIAVANQKESQVLLNNKKTLYDRTLNMYKNSGGKYPSKNELDDTRFSYEAAIESLEAAKAKVLQAQSNLKTGEILHTFTYGGLYDIQTSKVTWDGVKYGDNEKAKSGALYVEDAIPPDGKDFTVGDQLPAPNDIQDGHYHRQTYSMLPAANRPADRLLQWNASKKRWILIETNNRYEYQSNKQTIAKILNSDTKFNPDIKL